MYAKFLSKTVKEKSNYQFTKQQAERKCYIWVLFSFTHVSIEVNKCCNYGESILFKIPTFL
jgi:hypothetical protein